VLVQRPHGADVQERVQYAAALCAIEKSQTIYEFSSLDEGVQLLDEDFLKEVHKQLLQAATEG
jgi:hypothetical protein